jgi:TQXA domain-containing protein/LPXTG-motif cell wall-anchored protein
VTTPRTTLKSSTTPLRGRRILAGTVALGLASMIVAPAAMAADQAWAVSGWHHASSVRFTDGSSTTALIQIKNTSDETLDTYCIQRTVSTGKGDGKTELDWDSSGIKNLTNVAWILNHSYPTVTVAELEAAVEKHEGGKDITLSEDEAVAGTQASIWHYTDDATISADNNSDVIDVYEYLTDPKLNTGIAEQPATLSIEGPSTDSYLDLSQDNLVGPFTVSTSINEVAVSSTAGTVVDAQGKPVTTAKDGDELYIAVPKGTAPGTAKITVSGTGTMPAGRVFAPTPGKKTQTLITASSKSVKLSDSETATWYAKPNNELPLVPPTPEPTPITPELPPVEPTPVDPTPITPELPPVTPETPAPVEPQPEPTPVPTPEPEQPESYNPPAEEPATDDTGVDDAEESADDDVAVAGTEELAHTGGSLTAAFIGAGLLAGGAGLVIAGRRRQV